MRGTNDNSNSGNSCFFGWGCTKRTVVLNRKESKVITRRGWIVLIVLIALLISGFTYATRDVCYVGKDGNWLGYGSCTKMIDQVVGKDK